MIKKFSIFVSILDSIRDSIRVSILVVLLATPGMTPLALANTNNNNNNEPSQATTPACSNNQNNSYDPRIPPAGAYVVNHADGSSNNIYSTGEKKPYYVDNNCNSNTSTPTPDIVLQPTIGK